MYVMRVGPQLGVDAYGVSGFTRSCAPASSRSRLSFCTLLRRSVFGRRFYKTKVKSLVSLLTIFIFSSL